MLVGARLLQFAGALVALGASLFQGYGFRVASLQSPPMQRNRRWLRHLLLASAAAACVGTILWIMAETVLFSGDPRDATRFSAVWVVFSDTRFGRVCLLRLGLLVAFIAASATMHRARLGWVVQSILASLIIATFAWTGHGAMDSGLAGLIHATADILHLWVAGVWFGALAPITILIVLALRSVDIEDTRAAYFGLERFSAIGIAVVIALTITGLVNSWFLVGISNWRTAFASAYGQTLFVKLGVFGLMLLLAAANRFWLTPRLGAAMNHADGQRSSSSLRALRYSLLAESSLAALLVGAVAVLGTLAPPNSGE
ncbi:MAG: copper homeostasis membrane protein CopD [Steroidobacteraceae bacterium]